MSHDPFRIEPNRPAVPAADDRSRPDTALLVTLAREAGMLVMLDAQIGRERYESVSGSVDALARFVHAVQLALADTA
ncbi:hypothetical protein ACRS8P_33030 [Burkholderia cenocepacia]